MDCDQVVPEKQVVVSPPKAPLSLTTAAKLTPFNEAKLRRLVASGQLRSVVVEPDPSAKRSRGRQTKIWIHIEDLEALDPCTAAKKGGRAQGAAPTAKVQP